MFLYILIIYFTFIVYLVTLDIILSNLCIYLCGKNYFRKHIHKFLDIHIYINSYIQTEKKNKIVLYLYNIKHYDK